MSESDPAKADTEDRLVKTRSSAEAIVNPPPIPIPQVPGLTVDVDGEDDE